MTRDRRMAVRVRFIGGILPPSARIHPGRDVIIVDMSAHGALVEGVWRLRPGGRIELQLDLHAREALVRGRVERCYVASLHHSAGVRYRAAIRFDGPIAFAPPRDLLDGYSVPDRSRDLRAVPGHGLPRKHVSPALPTKYRAKLAEK
jgi:hypothetical protein